MAHLLDILRLLHNLVRIGEVVAVDHGEAGVRAPGVVVRMGELETDPRPWVSARAGTTRDWDPPTAGEQVLVLSPGGDLGHAVVITGIYTAATPAPSDDPDLWRREWPDGTTVEYDHAAHRLLAVIEATTVEADREQIRLAHGATSVTLNNTALTLASNGSTVVLDAAGVEVAGQRIDWN